MASVPSQRVSFHDFDTTPLKGLATSDDALIIGSSDPLRQLAYIQTDLRILKCKTVVVEDHYVDRDYMEDHSVFYSRSLYPYKNYCSRLHFFAADLQVVRRALPRLMSLGARFGREAFIGACRRFSEKYYLGFCVVKPLPGSPIGRTAIRCYPPAADDGATRHFTCARDYSVHLMGVELTVRGLVFQQQDVGVSACATTAIWVSLNKSRDFEAIGNATPAQITAIASSHTLPFGRAMPSEGLSIDQMCQAVQAVGLAPDLLRLRDGTTGQRGRVAPVAASYLHTVLASGMAPILVLRRGPSRHAVAAVGYRLQEQYDAATATGGVYHESGDMQAVYVNDDRIGPYVRGDLIRNPDGLDIRLRTYFDPTDSARAKYEEWQLTHLLVPMHPKIRLSVAALSDLALQVTASVQAAGEYLELNRYIKKRSDQNIKYKTWINLASRYVESLMWSNNHRSRGKPELILSLVSTVALSRYVGVLQFGATWFGTIHVVVDTTSTRRNLNCLAVIALDTDATTNALATFLALKLKCPVVGQ